jgi:3D (Asp-Asp-Asp) domain-containing protein
MKKVNWSVVKKVFSEIVCVLVVSAVFWGVLFALAEPFMSKGECVYAKNKNADLGQNNEKEAVVVVVEEKEVVQEPITEQPKRVSLGEFKLTAYCSCNKCCGFWANGRPLDENGNDIVIGASGERLYQGVSVAVDPAVIPYDSKVYIDGKEYIAHDCGGAIKCNRIDVYFDNHEDALRFGVQYANVEVDAK